MAKLTVKDLREKLEEFEDSKLVGYIGPFSEFHPLSDSDVYNGSAHFDPTGKIKDWRALVKDTPVRGVVHINCAQVRPRVDRIAEYDEESVVEEAVDIGREKCKEEVAEIYKSSNNPDELANKICDYLNEKD